jgi:hypothetical protein
MFIKEFPRIYELRDQIETPDSPNSCLKNLDALLQDAAMRRAYRPIEDALQELDSVAWESLRKKASECLTKWDEKKGRGQQQLIDILNEGLAYSFLKREVGCSDIHFIPESKKKGEQTPDLEGALGQIKILCEVKTINASEDEVVRRRCGHYRHDKPQLKLEQGFFDKLMNDLTKAKKQMEAYAADKEARHIAYIIPNFDDFWGEYKEDYFQQVDQYLCENIIHGIEIVFHNQRIGFHKAITMKCATVFNEPDCP